jgi:hypothetical protein
MTEAELREFIADLALTDNGKVVILIGYNPDDGEYYRVQVDNQGRIVTTT